MKVVNTLAFLGRAEEAIEHYREVLGAEILYLARFSECPDPSLVNPAMGDLIFHATLRIGETVIMASDVGCESTDQNPEFRGFALLLQMESPEHARQVFEGLSDGGRVIVPLEKSTFTALYGIVVDRFGVSWKINLAEQQATD